MLFAGFNVSRGEYSLLAVTLVGSFANLVGSWVAYWIGYAGRVDILEKHGKKLHIKPSYLKWADRLVREARRRDRLLHAHAPDHPHVHLAARRHRADAVLALLGPHLPRLPARGSSCSRSSASRSARTGRTGRTRCTTSTTRSPRCIVVGVVYLIVRNRRNRGRRLRAGGGCGSLERSRSGSSTGPRSCCRSRRRPTRGCCSQDLEPDAAQGDRGRAARRHAARARPAAARARGSSLATAPAALAGLLLEKPIEERLGTGRGIAAGLVAGAVAMAVADARAERRGRERLADATGATLCRSALAPGGGARARRVAPRRGAHRPARARLRPRGRPRDLAGGLEAGARSGPRR